MRNIECFSGLIAVLLPSDADGQCNIPSPVPGTFYIFYITDVTHGRDVVLQLEFVREDHDVTLICSTLVGEECFRLTLELMEPGRRTKKKPVN